MGVEVDLQALKEEAVQIAFDTVRAAVCPTIGLGVGKLILPEPYALLALNIAVQGTMGAVRFPCSDGVKDVLGVEGG